MLVARGRAIGTVTFLAALLTNTIAPAQLPPDLSNTELGKETENPFTRFIVLPFRYEGDLYYGAYNADQEHV